MKGLYFLVGMAVGAVGTYFVMKRRVEEMEREFYDDRYEESPENNEEIISDQIPEKPSIKDYMAYAKEISENRYAKEEDVKEVKDDPYVITPDEYGSMGEEYDMVPLNYFNDGVLAYERDDTEVDNADDLVGTDFKSKFGQYEEGMVYVRCDRDKTDYAIFKDDRSYEEVSGNKPHRVEVK